MIVKSNLEIFTEEILAPISLRVCLSLQDITKNHKELLNKETEINKTINDLIDYLEALQFVYLPCASIAKETAEQYLLNNTKK